MRRPSRHGFVLRARRALGALCVVGLCACTPPGPEANPARDAGEEASPSPGGAMEDAGDEGPERDATPPAEDAGADAAVVADAAADAAADADAAPPPPYPGRPGLCERPGDDIVREVFCGAEAPVIGDLAALQHALRVYPDARSYVPAEEGEVPPGSAEALALGLSTALSGRHVSAINPRIILLTGRLAMAFQRGTTVVEIAAHDRRTSQLNFYLVSFELACHSRPEGCLPGDLYTPAIEREWNSVRLEDDEDLKNTPSDCRQCHQRARDEPMLLMRELRAPWTHFFGPPVNAGPSFVLPGVSAGELSLDYLEARGNERIGGALPEIAFSSVGFVLESVVRADQPLLFDAPRIDAERFPFGPDGFATDPQPSPTWLRAYEAFKRGENLALPHYETRPTDPEKQARLSEAYAQYQRGELPARELPDLADVYPDDPQKLAELGFVTEPGATPAEALVQACGSCHNDVLDQTISRARFNVDLARMDTAERERAIARIQADPASPGVMPPKEARQLSDEARAALLDYLTLDARPEADDAFLHHAAVMGMAGNGIFDDGEGAATDPVDYEE